VLLYLYTDLEEWEWLWFPLGVWRARREAIERAAGTPVPAPVTAVRVPASALTRRIPRLRKRAMRPRGRRAAAASRTCESQTHRLRERVNWQRPTSLVFIHHRAAFNRAGRR
jgi:hypothetical protein